MNTLNNLEYWKGCLELAFEDLDLDPLTDEQLRVVALYIKGAHEHIVMVNDTEKLINKEE